MKADTDPMDIDGESQLTATERDHVRRLLRADDRATWARKQLRVLVPIIVAAVVGLWQFAEWLGKHFKP